MQFFYSCGMKLHNSSSENTFHTFQTSFMYYLWLISLVLEYTLFFDPSSEFSFDSLENYSLQHFGTRNTFYFFDSMSCPYPTEETSVKKKKERKKKSQ